MQTKIRRGRAVAPACKVLYVDERKVASARKGIPGPASLREIADVFSVLCDETRLRILYALTREELCVCDLAQVAGRSIPAVSHQLADLRRLRIVTYRPEGKLAYYRLDSEPLRRLLADAAGRCARRARESGRQSETAPRGS